MSLRKASVGFASLGALALGAHLLACSSDEENVSAAEPSCVSDAGPAADANGNTPTGNNTDSGVDASSGEVPDSGSAPDSGTEPDSGVDSGTDAGADSGVTAVTPAPPLMFLGGNSSCAILASGAMKCWGADNVGQTGRGTIDQYSAPPSFDIDLGTGRTALAAALDSVHVCAILDDFTLKCWGQTGLGYGDTKTRGDRAFEMGDNLPTVDVGTGRKVYNVDAHGGSTCAVLDDSSLKCWGANANGQLGLGDTAARGNAPGQMGDALPAVSLGTGLKPIQVAVGATSSCVLFQSGSVKCWGDNSSGQLGQGDTVARGDNPNEMGDNLPPIALGTGRTVLKVGVGTGYACAQLDNDTLKCWGTYPGALGAFTLPNHGDDPNEMGDNLAVVDFGTGRKVIDFAVQDYALCAQLDDLSIKCIGRNATGELGQGDTTPRIDPTTWGNALPAIALGTGRTSVTISVGAEHACVRFDDWSVKCWGGNENGQLGVGDTTNRGDKQNTMGDQLPTVFPASKP